MATTVNIMGFEDATVYSCLTGIPPTIVISIDDPGWPITPIDIDNPSIIGVLKLWFCDTDDEWGAMTETDAKRVVEFVKSHESHHPEILVHCAAGRSRSAGVAAALCRWLNGSDDQVMDSPHRRPNFTCYERVLDAAGVEHDPEEDRRRFDAQRKLVEGYERADGMEEELALQEEPDDGDEMPAPLTRGEALAMEEGWDEVFSRISGDGSFHKPTKLGEYLARALGKDDEPGDEDEWDY